MAEKEELNFRTYPRFVKIKQEEDVDIEILEDTKEVKDVTCEDGDSDDTTDISDFNDMLKYLDAKRFQSEETKPAESQPLTKEEEEHAHSFTNTLTDIKSEKEGDIEIVATKTSELLSSKGLNFNFEQIVSDVYQRILDYEWPPQYSKVVKTLTRDEIILMLQEIVKNITKDDDLIGIIAATVSARIQQSVENATGVVVPHIKQEGTEKQTIQSDGQPKTCGELTRIKKEERDVEQYMEAKASSPRITSDGQYCEKSKKRLNQYSYDQSKRIKTSVGTVIKDNSKTSSTNVTSEFIPDISLDESQSIAKTSQTSISQNEECARPSTIHSPVDSVEDFGSNTAQDIFLAALKDSGSKEFSICNDTGSLQSEYSHTTRLQQPHEHNNVSSLQQKPVQEHVLHYMKYFNSNNLNQQKSENTDVQQQKHPKDVTSIEQNKTTLSHEQQCQKETMNQHFQSTDSHLQESQDLHLYQQRQSENDVLHQKDQLNKTALCQQQTDTPNEQQKTILSQQQQLQIETPDKSQQKNILHQEDQLQNARLRSPDFLEADMCQQQDLEKAIHQQQQSENELRQQNTEDATMCNRKRSQNEALHQNQLRNEAMNQQKDGVQQKQTDNETHSEGTKDFFPASLSQQGFSQQLHQSQEGVSLHPHKSQEGSLHQHQSQELQSQQRKLSHEGYPIQHSRETVPQLQQQEGVQQPGASHKQHLNTGLHQQLGLHQEQQQLENPYTGSAQYNQQPSSSFQTPYQQEGFQNPDSQQLSQNIINRHQQVQQRESFQPCFSLPGDTQQSHPSQQAYQQQHNRFEKYKQHNIGQQFSSISHPQQTKVRQQHQPLSRQQQEELARQDYLRQQQEALAGRYPHVFTDQHQQPFAPQSQVYTKQHQQPYSMQQVYANRSQHPHVSQQQQPYASQQQPYASQQQPYASQQQPYASQQQPYVSRQQQPYASRQQQPYASQQHQPHSSRQQQPYSSRQQQPYSSRQQQPYASQQQQPYASQQQQPYASQQQQQFASQQQQQFASQQQQQFARQQQYASEQQLHASKQRQSRASKQWQLQDNQKWQPHASQQQQPDASQQQQPHASQQQQPHASQQQQPHASQQQQPHASQQQKQHIYQQQQPRAWQHQQPHAWQGQQAYTRQGQQRLYSNQQQQGYARPQKSYGMQPPSQTQFSSHLQHVTENHQQPPHQQLNINSLSNQKSSPTFINQDLQNNPSWPYQGPTSGPSSNLPPRSSQNVILESHGGIPGLPDNNAPFQRHHDSVLKPHHRHIAELPQSNVQNASQRAQGMHVPSERTSGEPLTSQETQTLPQRLLDASTVSQGTQNEGLMSSQGQQVSLSQRSEPQLQQEVMLKNSQGQQLNHMPRVDGTIEHVHLEQSHVQNHRNQLDVNDLLPESPQSYVPNQQQAVHNTGYQQTMVECDQEIVIERVRLRKKQQVTHISHVGNAGMIQSHAIAQNQQRVTLAHNQCSERIASLSQQQSIVESQQLPLLQSLLDGRSSLSLERTASRKDSQ